MQSGTRCCQTGRDSKRGLRPPSEHVARRAGHLRPFQSRQPAFPASMRPPYGHLSRPPRTRREKGSLAHFTNPLARPPEKGGCHFLCSDSTSCRRDESFGEEQREGPLAGPRPVPCEAPQPWVGGAPRPTRSSAAARGEPGGGWAPRGPPPAGALVLWEGTGKGVEEPGSLVSVSEDLTDGGQGSARPSSGALSSPERLRPKAPCACPMWPGIPPRGVPCTQQPCSWRPGPFPADSTGRLSRVSFLSCVSPMPARRSGRPRSWTKAGRRGRRLLRQAQAFSSPCLAANRGPGPSRGEHLPQRPEWDLRVWRTTPVTANARGAWLQVIVPG